MSQSSDADRARAAARPNDVIAAVLEDHADIKSMMNDFAVARSGGQREAMFTELVAKLAVHETAEEEVVHPLARDVVDDKKVVEQRLQEEDTGKKALAELEQMGVDAPDFDQKFQNVRDEVLAHAEHEEHEELPKLERGVPQERLEKAATLFRAAQRMAPTHAHEHSPESAAGNVLLGPFVAVADRTRDAIRKLMSDSPT
jgi:hypothetical protein